MMEYSKLFLKNEVLTRFNVNEPQQWYAKLKKLVQKSTHGIIYLRVSNQVNLQND